MIASRISSWNFVAIANMTNFSPLLKTQSLQMPMLSLQPGLKFHSDYMGFLSMFDQPKFPARFLKLDLKM